MAKILFPTDFSKTANNAYLYALNLAKVLNTSVRLVTIRPNLNDYLTMYEEDFSRKVEELHQLAVSHHLSEVEVESSLIIGDVLISILDCIEKESIQYVVMGTNGENSFGKKLFGSETLNVVRSSPIPVLAIPDHVHFKDNRNFAFATMFNDKEENALAEMIRIVKRYNKELNVVHVENKLNSYDSRMKKREWEVNHPTLEVDIVSNHDVDTALLDYCHSKNIDVLGIVQRDLSVFERLFSISHSKQLITNADFAILVLHGNSK